MERIMSVEDKIRRAEEIYNRRHENEYKVTNTRVRVENAKEYTNQNINRKLRKMIIQIVVCMLIYLSFNYIVKKDYIFSKDFKNKCEEILAYDISFSEMYKNISDIIIQIQQKYQKQEDNQEVKEEEKTEEEGNKQNEEKQEEIKEETKEENNEKAEESAQDNVQEAQNIGGAIVAENTEKVEENQKLSEEEQMKKDAEEIKSKINFIKPLTGTITSLFGWRDSNSSIVSKYHTGIDIAAKEGTNIVSTTNGKVVLKSSEGAYGNHLKIQIEDITIIYAHCSKLEVKEGDEITQGQVIAKVGSTGNSTGPHLHFEIRKEDRYVNPSLILDF